MFLEMFRNDDTVNSPVQKGPEQAKGIQILPLAAELLLHVPS